MRGRHRLQDRFLLGDLVDVTLDLKTIQRVTDGNSMIAAVRLIDSKVGPAIENARVILVGACGREVRLTEEYLPHYEATASLGRIRVFLRKHGLGARGRARDRDGSRGSIASRNAIGDVVVPNLGTPARRGADVSVVEVRLTRPRAWTRPSSGHPPTAVRP